MLLPRNATIADLETLLAWDQLPHVVASDPSDDWDWAKELQETHSWREQLIAELDGQPIGVVQIIDPAQEETHYWGEVQENLRAIDVWIGPATHLDKGYGTQMMTLALARCFENSAVTAVLIDPLASNTRAHAFYERLGFRFVELRQFGGADCFVYQLLRADWEAQREAGQP